MEIIYKDKYLVACVKPAGVLSEGDGKDCLPYLVSQHLSSLGENADVFVLHRLDRETSGLCVLARTQQAAARVSASITEGSFKKQYLAVVGGTPTAPEGVLNDLLFYDRQRGKTFVVDRERKGVKRASLSYRVLATDGEASLLKIDLHTGRTHQIRAQFGSRGNAVLGDRRYGGRKSDGRGIALLSYRISLPHPVTNIPLELVAQSDGELEWARGYHAF